MHVSPVGRVSVSARSTERLPEHATCQLCRDAEWLRLGWRASGGRFPPNADPRRKGSLWWGLRTEWGIPPQSLAPGALDTQAPVVVSSRNRLARSGALPRGRAPAAHPRCLAVRPSCFAAHPVRALTRATNGTRAPLDLATRRAPHAPRDRAAPRRAGRRTAVALPRRRRRGSWVRTSLLAAPRPNHCVKCPGIATDEPPGQPVAR